LDAALIDIEEYYNAGTLLGAFVGITASAGLKVEESEVNKALISKGKTPEIFSPLTNVGGTERQPQTDVGPNSDVTGSGIEDTTSNREMGLTSTTTKQAIHNWLKNDIDKAKRNELMSWINRNQIKNTNGKDVSPTIFKQDDDFEEERKSAIRDLDIPQ